LCSSWTARTSEPGASARDRPDWGTPPYGPTAKRWLWPHLHPDLSGGALSDKGDRPGAPPPYASICRSVGRPQPGPWLRTTRPRDAVAIERADSWVAVQRPWAGSRPGPS